MKTRIYAFFATVIVMVVFSANASGQASATATATATIVTPISITTDANMNFGNIAVSAAPGTVVLTPAGGRTPTGGVTLPAVGGTVSAAVFTVAGTPAYTYAITLPAAATTVTSGANTMTVDTFTSTPAGTGTLDGTGSQALQVGATLNVAANQPSGTYVSGTPFTVTVNYN